LINACRFSCWIYDNIKPDIGIICSAGILSEFVYRSNEILLVGDDRLLVVKDKAKNDLLAKLADSYNLVSDDPMQQARLLAIDKLIAQCIEQSDMALELRHVKGIEAAAAYIASIHGDNLPEKITTKINDLIDKEKYLLKKRREFADVISSSTIFTIGFLWVTSLLCLMWSLRILQREIHNRTQTEEALHEKSNLLENVINSSTDFIFVKDRDLRTILCNTAFAHALGKSLLEIYGNTDIENGWSAELVFGCPEKGIHGFQQDDLVALSGEIVHNSNDLANIGDEIRNFDSIKVPLRSTDGKITGLLGISRDVTERKADEEQIKQLAFYDSLTQLPNRRQLKERLKHALNLGQREGKHLALLMLDLDHFKAVNDNLGHLAGDELLQQVAARLTARLRETDMVARLGGDEFIVFLEGIAFPEDAARVAKEIITDLTKPFCLTQGDNVQIGASIGISLCPQHGDDPDMLMDHADEALYQAKDAGRGCFAYFSEDLTLAAKKRIELEIRLRHAIEQKELHVFYQPQMDIASGQIIGSEALIRWQDPVNGLVKPIHFIPLAEKTGLIVEIDNWMLHETCRQGRQWLDMGLPPLPIAVNVSPHHFCKNNICDLVATVLEETGFPANQLELEITENGLMEYIDKATATFNSLRNLGVRLSIDDFGTGYSSLSYLKHFPLNVLKIDKSFIDDIPFHQDDMEIAATIIAMGRILGFKVLAEGVERVEQLDFLQEKGCDSYQGYIKSKPVPAHEFAKLLRNQQRDV